MVSVGEEEKDSVSCARGRTYKVLRSPDEGSVNHSAQLGLAWELWGGHAVIQKQS